MLYSVLRKIFQFLILIFNIEIRGDRDILKNYKNVLVCANHSSNWDPFFLSVVFRRKISWLAKIELFKNPIQRKLLLSLDTIPIDRDKADLKAIKEAMRCLKGGGVLGIFIEGTRVSNENEDNAKSGAIMIADKTSSPIIPVKVSSSYRLFKKTVITIGEVIYLDIDKSQYELEAKKLWNKIYELDGTK